jgi:hypothetical protein
LIIVGAGALTLGMSFADEPAKRPTGQEPSENHTTGSDRPAEPARGHIQDHPKQVVKSHEDTRDRIQAKHASVNDIEQPALKRAAPAASHELMMNKIENRPETQARLPAGGGTAALAPGAVRSRSATETGIGGLATSTAKSSAAAINGTGMTHRPY